MRQTLALLVLFALVSSAYAEPPRKKSRTAKRSSSRNRLAPAAPEFDVAQINSSDQKEIRDPEAKGSAIVRAQILMSRAGFSCGEIDGYSGVNIRRAIIGFQASRNVPSSGILDSATWTALNSDTAPPLVTYKIAQADVAGPYEKIPADMMEKAQLKTLGYESAQEQLGEKFHINPGLLAKLNPGKNLTKVDEEILVPNTQHTLAGTVANVVVSKSASTVTAFDQGGKVVAQYPATIGSEHDPLPVGDWKVTSILHNPPFFYNPALFWDADLNHSKAKIPPGPNNPVGTIWIGLSKEHYGIHGTPEPSTVGHAQSHGCIRLTNWDAEELAGIAAKGMPVLLKE
jgi:lipoprotein-anchoring transpeptidase ErfK/SrfK